MAHGWPVAGCWRYRAVQQKAVFFLWKGLQVRRREGTGQRESKARPAQASTSTTKAQTQPLFFFFFFFSGEGLWDYRRPIFCGWGCG